MSSSEPTVVFGINDGAFRYPPSPANRERCAPRTALFLFQMLRLVGDLSLEKGVARKKLRCEATETREKAARDRVAEASAKLVGLGAACIENPVARSWVTGGRPITGRCRSPCRSG